MDEYDEAAQREEERLLAKAHQDDYREARKEGR